MPANARGNYCYNLEPEMGAIEAKLAELGIELPKTYTPIGAYVPCKVVGEFLWVSGMIPIVEGKLAYEGKVGAEVSLEQGTECARIASLNALAFAKQTLGTLDNIIEAVRVQGFVASAEGFFDQPKVINGASELLFSLFGEAGKHSRVAVGVSQLPMNAPVEIDFIFRVKIG